MIPLWTTVKRWVGSLLQEVSYLLCVQFCEEDKPVRMAVEAGGLAVSSPPGVRDSGMGNKGNIGVRLLLLNQSLEFVDLANLLESEDLILFVSIDRNAGGVVSTVLEPGQT